METIDQNEWLNSNWTAPKKATIAVENTAENSLE